MAAAVDVMALQLLDLPSLVALERLARYSHARLQHLAESLDLAFEHSPGTLLLLRFQHISRRHLPIVT